MDTHILFFILAGLLIAILVGYSIWSARREKSRIFSNVFTTRAPSVPVSHNLNIEIPTANNRQEVNTSIQHDAEASLQAEQKEVENSVKNIRISLQEQLPTESVFYTPGTEATQIDEAYQQPEVKLAPTTENVACTNETEEEGEANANIVTLYVVAPEGVQFQGNTIVQQLEMLGFHFGQYQIFHRHLDNAASPVLFSVANIMQPGVFDLTKIEQFSTVGLVFFMYLPSVGNDLANLKLMIRTVESFAQSVGGIILDEQHQMFNEGSRQSYLLRVAN